jgi:hypothetical protein
MRYAPGADPKVLVEVASGQDVNDTYAYAPRKGRTRLLYDRNTCGEAAASDIWKLVQPRLLPLRVIRRGAGGGTVTSDAGGISCGSDCLQPYKAGRSVTLTADAESTSHFTGWGGACSGRGPCTVKLDRARSVLAFFDPSSSFSLSVTKKGGGKGKVTSQPSGISCGADCWQSYSAGTAVTLTAAARKGSRFVKWRGACSGTGKCKLTVDRVKSVIAVFRLRGGSASLRWAPLAVDPRGAGPLG